MYALLLCMIEKVKHIVKMMGTVNSVLKDEKPFLIEKYKCFTTNYQNIYSYIVSKGVMKNLKELFLLEEMFPVA